MLSTKIKKGLSTNPSGKDKIINTYVINMYTVWTHFDWKNIKGFSLKICTDFEFFYEYGKVVPNFTSFKSYRIFFCNLCVPVLCGFRLEKMVKCDRKCFWKKELNAIASLCKSSICKTDRFLKIGRVWSLKSENEVTLIILFCSFLTDSNLARYVFPYIIFS